MREWNNRKIYNKQENKQLKNDVKIYYDTIKEDIEKSLTGEKKGDIITHALLDSSLIFQTNQENYTHKIVQCGDYYQVYDYNKKTIKQASNLEKMSYQNYKIKKKIYLDKEVGECSSNIQLELFQINDGFLDWSKTSIARDPPDWLHINEIIEIKKEETEKTILKKNVQRSKIELERLTKSNEKTFKTFITLTMAENITDIEKANSIFNVWRTKVQSVLKAQKKEFSYVCVPEFQKRGAIHYHLLTNLDVLENSDIIIPQKEFTEKQLQTMTEEQREKCKDVKYWKYGFSRVDKLADIDNVVGYISKYMTKDIDNRLWGKRRYLASHNLKKPSTLFIDCCSDKGFYQLLEIQNNCELSFHSIYTNPLGEIIDFSEFKKKEVINSV